MIKNDSIYGNRHENLNDRTWKNDRIKKTEGQKIKPQQDKKWQEKQKTKYENIIKGE